VQPAARNPQPAAILTELYRTLFYDSNYKVRRRITKENNSNKNITFIVIIIIVVVIISIGRSPSENDDRSSDQESSARYERLTKVFERSNN
jgi:hypothetical protein